MKQPFLFSQLLNAMKQYIVSILFFWVLIGISCKNEQNNPTKKLTSESILQSNIDSLKRTATKGDLIVRLNDDLISEQVKLLNETDKSYSHAGIIIEQNGQKYVCHIMPDLPGADTIQLTPIDSFINPLKNIKCALFRYKISANEKDSLQAILLNYKQKDTRFDRVYNLKSDDALYCSEMISKSLSKATTNNIRFRDIKVPQKMARMLEMYFKKYKNAKQMVAEGTFITIDNLYLIDQCQELMQFNLKIFPGQ
jgi:hypothetical protein